MLAALAFAAVAQACGSAQLTPEQAQGLALIAAAPQVARGVPVIADIEETGAHGWKLRVHGVNGCGGAPACSSLIGYFVVAARSGVVTDDDHRVVRNAHLMRTAARMRRENCRSRR